MKPVEIYSTPTCAYCNMAKEFFTEHNMPYHDYNVAQDEVKRNEMIEKTGQMGVPVIIIGEHTVIGFDETKIRSLLNITD